MPSLPPGYDPTGKIEQRDIVTSKDGWSEYTLSDDSVIRVKAVVIDVKRAVNQHDAQGEPLYVFQVAVVTNVVAPDKLKKKR